MDLTADENLHRLGVMGGTFDPIHLGHLIVASEVLHAFELDRVLFVPAARPWQKSSYADPEDRFTMTMLGASMHARFAVSRMELDRQGPTYTLQTMRALRDFYGAEVQLSFVLGADAALKLGSWAHIEGLGELADIIVVARPGFDLERFDPEPSWPKLRFAQVPAIDISSSDIRARVRAERPIDFLVPARVVRYINEHGLYRGQMEESGAD